MIASERSLPPPHPHQPRPKQRRQPPTTTKNGIKNPIRPVKVYVIDPRKFKQQQLEDSATQTREKDEDLSEIEKKKIENRISALINESLASKNLLPKTSTAATNTSETQKISAPVPALPSVSSVSVLPPLLPIFTTATSSTQTTSISHEPTVVTGSQNGTAVMTNGVALQCMAGFVPALPLVVTNGVALLQQPIVSASMTTGGIFLPGVTAIPGMLSNGAGIIGSTPAPIPTIQPKPKPKKKKPKRKKKVSQKKKIDEQKDDEEDDSEFKYLLKETATRSGRISRPVSQPHSPTPSIKTNKDKLIINEPTHSCEACLQEFVSLEEQKAHDAEFHPLLTDKPVEGAEKSQSNLNPSTNDHSQVPEKTHSGLEESKVQKETFSTSISNTIPAEPTNAKIDSEISSFNGFGASSKPTFDVGGSLPVNATNVIECVQYSSSTATALTTSSTDLPPVPSSQPSVATAASGNNSTIIVSSTMSNVYCTPSESRTKVNTSLVPNREEPIVMFLNNLPPAAPSIDVVPSSNSIPNSPSSRCQSPNFPDQTLHTNFTVKDGVNLTERACRSPVDPMLLRSRSPFPPPLHPDEVSLPSVSVSNLTIPEESLCKGELFMDLGDGMLESASLSRISPFCTEESMGPLFPNSPPKPASQTNDQSREATAVGEVDLDVDQDPADHHPVPASPPSVPTPVLLETTEDANDGEIFKTANYVRTMLEQPQSPDPLESPVFLAPSSVPVSGTENDSQNKSEGLGNNSGHQSVDFPKTPQSSYVESDISMDGGEMNVESGQTDPKRRSIWHFVKDQIKHRGISQACGEISEVAEKLSRIARDQFIPIREDEIERLGSTAPIIHVDTPFFSHLLDLPFGTYIFKEDVGRKKRLPPPTPITSSELSFTCGVEDVEKFLPPDIDLISLPHLTNLDLT